MTSENQTISFIDDLNYKFLVPPMILFCFISVLINARVLVSVHWIRRPISPTLYISLSLAAADALTSAALGTNLFSNSYLPVLYDINSPCSFQLILEIYRLSGVIITVFHLLALSINHYLGILKPLHYVAIMTTKKTTVVIIFLWLLPPVFLLSYFLYNSDDNFWECGCNEGFLFEITFRIVFSLFFCIPLIFMVFCYAHILIIVRKQQNMWAQLSRSGSTRNKGIRTSTQQKKTLEGNVKAVYTTLLILGSCMFGWLPALTWFFLICEEGCVYTPEYIRLHLPWNFYLSWLFNTLLIIKTLVNPIIYSTRMLEIEEGTRRMHLAFARLICRNRRNQYETDSQRCRLGCSASSLQGSTALYKINGSLNQRSIGKSPANTFV